VAEGRDFGLLTDRAKAVMLGFYYPNDWNVSRQE